MWTPPVPPAPQFGHSQTAAGVVGADGTNKVLAVDLALPQLNSHLVKSRVICANVDCDILGFRSPFMERQGMASHQWLMG